MNVTRVPREILSERLLFRPWQKADAVHLLPVLEANVAHLGDWIPAHVSAPAPLGELELRLAGFRNDFDTGRNWRFAVLSPDQAVLYGEVSLFPRSSEGRVDLAAADRLEIGYWLRHDVTGRGYATEAARTMLALARPLPAIESVEIHCDPRNTPSAAVPRRLGFRLVRTGSEPDLTSAENVALMVWTFDLRSGN